MKIRNTNGEMRHKSNMTWQKGKNKIITIFFAESLKEELNLEETSKNAKSSLFF